MTNNEYEVFVEAAQQPNSTVSPLVQWLVGLTGETGEVAELIKKGVLRQPGDTGYKELDHGQLALELGDVLFYLTSLALAAGLSLEQIQILNTQKLKGRGHGV